MLRQRKRAGGALRGAGQECPALKSFPGTKPEAGEITVDGEGLRVFQASAEERAAIERLLAGEPTGATGPGKPKGGLGQKTAGAKLVGVLFLVAAIGSGLPHQTENSIFLWKIAADRFHSKQ